MDHGLSKEFTFQITGLSVVITIRVRGVPVQRRWTFTRTREYMEDVSRQFYFLVTKSKEGLSELIGALSAIAGHMVGNTTATCPQ
mmetsp:Transcript_111185/g.192641  ORF Transcript_111185/g.192641 Transcript_111185/m.192641 type:complete len:85 (-) Transcript_111185:275-529(-)